MNYFGEQIVMATDYYKDNPELLKEEIDRINLEWDIYEALLEKDHNAKMKIIEAEIKKSIALADQRVKEFLASDCEKPQWLLVNEEEALTEERYSYYNKCFECLDGLIEDE